VGYPGAQKEWECDFLKKLLRRKSRGKRRAKNKGERERSPSTQKEDCKKKEGIAVLVELDWTQHGVKGEDSPDECPCTQPSGKSRRCEEGDKKKARNHHQVIGLRTDIETLFNNFGFFDEKNFV